MSNTSSLFLGDFVFQDFEVPEKISFGGGQRLVIKKLIGGNRVIDAMGGDKDAVSWSGIFMPTQSGQTALDRAKQIQAMMDSGLPIQLSFDQVLLEVVISKFEPEYQFYRIPYRISMEVLNDYSANSPASTSQNIDDSIGNDLANVNEISSAITSGAAANDEIDVAFLEDQGNVDNVQINL